MSQVACRTGSAQPNNPDDSVGLMVEQKMTSKSRGPKKKTKKMLELEKAARNNKKIQIG